MSEEITSFPLQWPAGWRRTPAYQRRSANFKQGRGRYVSEAGSTTGHWRGAERVSLGEGIRRVRRELRAFGVPEHHIVISSELRLRQDGEPHVGQAWGKVDQGVAVYWRVGTTWRCMAVDQYDRLPDNLAAIAATLDAMRAIERHGGATILDRAFMGFAALPAPEQWWQVLGVQHDASRDDIIAAHKRLAMEHHPDRGGDPDKMARINAARDQGLTT